ncbi:MAG: imidazole glycerol phosphate synthase subunit HisH [Vicinamibacterales bacterium]
MIALIDYGAGNLTSVTKALAAIEAEVYVPLTPQDVQRATGVIVPGVGHFAATRALDEAWRGAILERLGEGRPLLGICLGMQWLFEGSEEAPELSGLGLIGGTCFRLGRQPDPAPVKIPHVGWNSLQVEREASIVDRVPAGAQVYFTHSYAAPITGETVATTAHGETFASIVQRGQVAGVQFHPEKSGDVGLQILRNFIQIAR